MSDAVFCLINYNYCKEASVAAQIVVNTYIPGSHL